MQNILDPDFESFYLKLAAAEKAKNKIINIAVTDTEGFTGNISFCDMLSNAHNERVAKMLLWAKGGYKITVDDCEFADYLKSQYCAGGERAFDWDFMSEVYSRKFEIEFNKNVPCCSRPTKGKSGDLSGERIGLDIGASELKVCALVDGKEVFSEREPWLPKENSDPEYHYNKVLGIVKRAAAHLHKVDAIGISSAGMILENEIKVSSLYMSVSKADYPTARQLLRRVAENFPTAVMDSANDGDVAAFAGAVSLGESNMIGLSLGTSLAGGALKQGRLNGWINELAFVPVDLNPAAAVDEWSGDYGCGVNYLSQDCVIRLAERSGYTFDKSFTISEKMRNFAANASQKQKTDVFECIGMYLASAALTYEKLYKINNQLVMGGVIAAGGTIIVATAQKIIDNYNKDIKIFVPTGSNLGQSVAAAGLPIVQQK